MQISESYLIQDYLERKGLPNVIDLTNLPDAETIRKIRKHVKKLNEKFAEFFARDQNLITYYTPDARSQYPNLYLNPQTTEFRMGRRIEPGEMNWGVWDNGVVRIDPESAKAALEDLIQSSRYTVEYTQARDRYTNGHLKIVAPRLSAEANTKLREKVIEAISWTHYRTQEAKVFEYGNQPGILMVNTTDFSGMANFAKKLNELGTELYRDVIMGDRAKRYIVPVPTHDTTQNLKAFISNRRTKLKSNAREIETLTIANHGTLSSRTWGIEVESGGARNASTPKGWGRKYDGSLRSAYTGTGEMRWVDHDDCEEYSHNQYLYSGDELYVRAGDTVPEGVEPSSTSLNGHIVQIAAGDTIPGERWTDRGAYFIVAEDDVVENPDYTDPDYCSYCGEVEEDDWGNADDRDCAEFVSPILKSFHSRGLEQLVKELSEEPQNDSAGVHVHVGAGDLTPKQIGGLVFAYEMIEPLIETSYRRNVREYCQPRRVDSTMSILSQAKTVKYVSYRQWMDDPNRKGDEKYLESGERYTSLNLCALDAHGTVEFRAMGPVYEYEYLIKWAHFCREMVNLAAKEVPAKEWSKVKSFADVRALFAKYGEEAAAAVFSDMSELTTFEPAEELELQLAEV